MTTSLQWFQDIAPELYNEDYLDKINRFINMAQGEIDKTLFSSDDTYNLAVAYYAAHLLSLSSDPSANIPGSITMEKEGDLQRSYGNNIGQNSESNSTKYLDSYNRLIKSRVPLAYINPGAYNGYQNC